jgi:hypothetical protein
MLIEFRLYEGADYSKLLASTWAMQRNQGSAEAGWTGTVIVGAVLAILAALTVLDIYVFQRRRKHGQGDEADQGAQLTWSRGPRIDALTSLRFPAAGIIVFLHFRALPGFNPLLGWPFPFTIGVRSSSCCRDSF